MSWVLWYLGIGLFLELIRGVLRKSFWERAGAYDTLAAVFAGHRYGVYVVSAGGLSTGG